MAAIANLAVRSAFQILARQDNSDTGGADAGTGAAPADDQGPTITVPLAGTAGFCVEDNDFDGRIGLRVSAIFVILVGSLFGTLFPIVTRSLAARSKALSLAFFAAKYFGSGVIIATAFIHLLAPAADALTDPCLTGPITDYDWAEGIALMAVFVLFFVELIVIRYANFGPGPTHDHSHNSNITPATANDVSLAAYSDNKDVTAMTAPRPSHAPGEDHFGHTREHADSEDLDTMDDLKLVPENYAAQMTAIFILEFGVIFHSIFIGLTLAVAGDEFIVLYIVLVFHQTFEGLGLGTRLAAVPWAASKRWTPYFMAVGYSLSTPIAIAVGLGVRETYAPGSQTALITNGVFDAVSAGILLYTGLVELMAHEFMFSPTMRKASIRTLLSAFALMCCGAGLMALLGKWA